jgi:phage gp36-like protein
MYIEYYDLTLGVHKETLDVLVRTPENAENAIMEAMSEVESYLSQRYDIAAEFKKTGSARTEMVVKLVRDIALYNCYSIHNPVAMPEVRRQKYEDAIAFLKLCQLERSSLPLTRLTGENTPSSYVQFGSNNKRRNQM